MNRETMSLLAHADHPIAAPLDDQAVRELLTRAVPREDARVLDLGCGGGEWLLRALSAFPRLRAEGVDLSEAALDRAREKAGDRLVLHHGDAAEFSAPHRFDLVLSVGAAHAFGGLLPTLAAARALLAPGGRVLVGDGFWAGDPSPEAVETLSDLATTVDSVLADGWTPVHGHVSTRRELDDYEWAWTGSLAGWGLDHPGPDGTRAVAVADEHRAGWLRGYRDAFGFVCLVLRPTHG